MAWINRRKGRQVSLEDAVMSDKSHKVGTPPHACFVAKLQKMGI